MACTACPKTCRELCHMGLLRMRPGRNEFLPTQIVSTLPRLQGLPISSFGRRVVVLSTPIQTTLGKVDKGLSPLGAN